MRGINTDTCDHATGVSQDFSILFAKNFDYNEMISHFYINESLAILL